MQHLPTILYLNAHHILLKILFSYENIFNSEVFIQVFEKSLFKQVTFKYEHSFSLKAFPATHERNTGKLLFALFNKPHSLIT